MLNFTSIRWKAIVLFIWISCSTDIFADNQFSDIDLLEDKIIGALVDPNVDVLPLIEGLKSFLPQGEVLINGKVAYYTGEYYYYKENWAEAANFYVESLKYFTLLNDSSKMAAAYNNLGLVYSFQGDFDKSLDAYSQSLFIELNLNNQIGIAQCYQNMAIVFANGNQVERAIEFYSKAADIFEKEKDMVEVAAVNNNLGALYAELTLYDQAEAHYKKSISIYRSLNMERNEARVLCNIGSLMVRKQEFEHGSKLVERALLLMKSHGDGIGEASAYTLLGDLYHARKDYQQAIFLYGRGQRKAEELNLRDLQAKIAQSLYYSFKAMNQWQNALTAYEDYVRMRDLLLAENPDYNMGILNEDLEQKIGERDFLIQKAKTRERFFHGIIGFVSIAALLGFFIASNRRRRLKHQKDIEMMRKQLMRDRINPGFIINMLVPLREMLNSGETEQAVKHLDNVSELIRKMLEHSCEELIPLSREIDFLKSYFDLQSIRYNSKIEYRIESDLMKNADEVLVPSMLTQPFLEQAFSGEHFTGTMEHPSVNIAFMRRGNLLEVIIEDNGHDAAVYRCSRLEERHKAMRVTIATDSQSRSAFRKKQELFGALHTEERTSGNVKQGRRVRFSLPLLTN